MQATTPNLKRNLQSIGMLLGFLFFALFVFKASHDVSNPKIAAGVQHRKQTVGFVVARNDIMNDILNGTLLSEAAQAAQSDTLATKVSQPANEDSDTLTKTYSGFGHAKDKLDKSAARSTQIGSSETQVKNKLVTSED